MRNHFTLHYVAIFLLTFVYAYGNNAVLSNECRNNFITSCLALFEQAKNDKDKENIKLYRAKLLDIMDGACRKDYQTCLVLARIYEPKENMAAQAIQKDIDKIPSLRLPIQNNLDSKEKYFENTESIVALMREDSDEEKALRYQEKAVSLLEQACYDSSVRACLLLHYFYEYGVAVPQNRPKAERLVTLALEIGTRDCMLGDNLSCKFLNAHPTYTDWIDKDIVKLERKCGDKDSTSCYQAGLYYTQNFYTDKEASKTVQDDKSDFIKAAQFLQKACKIDTSVCANTIFRIKNAKECLMDNDVNACANTQSKRPEFIALACEQGDMRSCYGLRDLPTFNDTKRYVKLLQRVCRSGIIESCVQLSIMYEKGERVAKNKERALSFMQRACAWSMTQKASNDYCYFSGLGYENGEYVKQDITKAAEAYKYACEISKENSSSCERLGMLYENAMQNIHEALKWYQKACKESEYSSKSADSNNGMDSDKSRAILSCMRVAQNLVLGKYLNVSVHDAISIYEKLLQNNAAPQDNIYYQLADIYSTTELRNNGGLQENPYIDYSKALQYYKKACKLGMQSACNKKITLPDLTKECKKDNAKSCYQLAMLTELLQDDESYKDMLIIPTDSMTLQSLNVVKPSDIKPLEKAKKESLELYTKACRGNVAGACKKLYVETNGKFEKDLALQEAMCLNLRPDKEAKSACIEFAKSALQENDYKKAIEALTPYQSKDDAKALDLLAQAFFYNKDYKGVLDTYKRIYTYNMENDYYYLAKMYIHGLGVEQNHEKALSIYKLSESPRSYLGQAEMYVEGLGMSKSIVSAKEYYGLACPLDASDVSKISSEACVRLGSIIYDEGDFQTSQKYYLKACAAGYNGDTISCDKK